jgi:hypothetical protein
MEKKSKSRTGRRTGHCRNLCCLLDLIV